MTDALSELKAACQREPSRSESSVISQGRWTWFRGRPAYAPDGTIALALSDDARVIINTGDVQAVKKEGEHFHVAVNADAYVLLRMEKLLKATPSSRCHRDGSPLTMESEASQHPKSKPIIDIDIGPITICDVVCGDIVLLGQKIHVCVEVNCHTLPS
jgi:hypothetical protein